MPMEENKALTHRYMEEIRNRGNLTVMDEIITTDFIHHSLDGDLKGLDAFKQYVNAMRVAFPDMHFKVEDSIAEGDKVVARCTVTGTHKGEFMGIPATYKNFKIPGTSIIRIAGGKVAEIWPFWDRLGMMKQLGVAPLSMKMKR